MKWLALISYFAMVIINGLASTVGINGKKTGEISNQVDVLFIPAGYVFSIWGLIYFLLFIWLVQQFRSSTTNRINSNLGLFVITAFLNIAWLLSWHYELFITSIVIMVGLLVHIIFLYVSYPKEDNRFSGRLPFSVYLGWISVALMANISFVLKYYEWDGFGLSEEIWAQLLLILATVLAAFIRVYKQDVFFPLVIIWAFIGIAIKNGEDAGSIFYMPFIYSLFLVIWIFIGRPKRL
ncbi:TspO/MBR family protein [Lysinibacillus capsici]|uniref:TspO/MBR family protein n=1 Tax=Lysinibacillus capsici TaxID=2115968 RepID=UPI003D070E0F